MSIEKIVLVFIIVSLAFSLVATLATYNFYYSDPKILDASLVHRGWPLFWIFESWSFWSDPPRYVCLFQPLNFLIDFIFYAGIFQIPVLLYLTFRWASTLKTKTAKNETPKTAVMS